MDEQLDESVVVDVAPPLAPMWLYHWHRPLVVVVDVLCSGFALLDESIALVSLGQVVIVYIGFWFFILFY